jgi:RimJ/RimL family protein N-acetyltransferase
MFTINDEKANPTIGVCGLTDIDYIHRKAEFSIYVAPEAQKHGHGENALRCLLDFGFKDLGLNRIWGETYEGNVGLKLYPKVGFVEEGHLRESYYKKGEFIDSYIFAILRDEWLK